MWEGGLGALAHDAVGVVVEGCGRAGGACLHVTRTHTRIDPDQPRALITLQAGTLNLLNVWTLTSHVLSSHFRQTN